MSGVIEHVGRHITQKTKIKLMKIKSLFLTLLLFLFFNSCKKSEVSFEETQPQNIKEQNVLPNKLIGTYYNSENKTELNISKYFIVKHITLEDTFKITELNKNEVIKNDSLLNIETKGKYQIKKINDTLFTNYIYSDTIFNLKQKDILKKFKGHYFLNKLIKSDGLWEVKKLTLTNGTLKISGIETEEEINLLESITETKRDTIKPFTIKPTKKQFKEFIKKNGFSEGEIYLKK